MRDCEDGAELSGELRFVRKMLDELVEEHRAGQALEAEEVPVGAGLEMKRAAKIVDGHAPGKEHVDELSRLGEDPLARDITVANPSGPGRIRAGVGQTLLPPPDEIRSPFSHESLQV